MASDTLLLRMQTVGAGTVAAEIGRADAAVGRYDSSARRAHGATTMLGGAFRSLAGMVGIAGAGAALVKAGSAFINFQAQMTKLQTQTGATKGEVASASAGILAMAASVGTGPQSLAEAMYHIESTGKRGATALDMLKVAALGAKVGNANLTDVTNALSATVVSGIKGSGDYNKAMGMLNATVGAGDMTMQDLADAMHGTAVVAKSAGLGLIDMGAALAVLGDNNIRGAKASNMLSMGLRVLMADSGPTAAAQHALGLTQNQLANDLRKPNGLVKMLETLHVKLKDKSPAEQATAIMKIFGAKAGVGMLTLYNQMDRLKGKYGEIGKGANGFGKSVEATKGTLAFHVAQLKALGEVVLIKLGASILKVIKAVDGFIKAFQQGKTWAVALMAAMAALGAGLVVWGAITTAVAIKVKALAVVQWLLNAAMTANPIGLIILAIVAFAAILLVLYNKVTPVRDALNWVWQAGKDVFNWFKEAFSKVAGFISTAFSGVAGVVGSVFEGVKSVVIGAINFVIDRINDLIKAYNAIPLAPNIGLIGRIGGPAPTGVTGSAYSGLNAAVTGGSANVTQKPATTAPIVSPSGNVQTQFRAATPGAFAATPPFEVTAATPIHIDGTQVGTALVKVGLRAKARS